MSDEVKKGAETGADRLTREMEQFRPRLAQVVDSRPNIRTMKGLGDLGHNLQRGLILLDRKGFLGGEINESLTEMGARLVATILDHDEITLGYEVRNLEAWLYRKGMGVEVQEWAEGKIEWSGGLADVRGHMENREFFQDRDLTPGAIALAYDFMANELTGMIGQHEDFDEDVRALGLVRAVAQMISIEIKTLANTGALPAKGVYLRMLSEYFSSFGLLLFDRSNNVQLIDQENNF